MCGSCHNILIVQHQDRMAAELAIGDWRRKRGPLEGAAAHPVVGAEHDAHSAARVQPHVDRWISPPFSFASALTWSVTAECDVLDQTAMLCPGSSLLGGLVTVSRPVRAEIYVRVDVVTRENGFHMPPDL